MKKVIIALSTLCAFFVALFFVGAKCYADELPVDTTEHEVVEVNDGNTDVIEPVEEASDDLPLNISEDDAKEIASIIGAYTNDKVEELTISMYYAFGVMGIVLVILFILLVVFAVSKAKNNAQVSALLSGIKEYLQQSNETTSKALLEIVNLSNDETKEMLTKVIDGLKEAKFTNYSGKALDITESLKAISELSKNSKVD